MDLNPAPVNPDPPQLVAINPTVLTASDTVPQQGGWAQLVAGLHWPRAREGMVLTSDFLTYLDQMPVIREIIWRRGKNQHDICMFSVIGDCLSRIEASRM